jgi:hypothetical protein
MNGDNQLDILITNFHKKSITLLFNMGNETFSNKTKYETDYQPRFLKIVNINNYNISFLEITLQT